MKKILFTGAILFCSLVMSAQTLVATLTHGTNTKIFYGTYAFENAMKEAVNGDLINLSEGSFNIESITKAVTIRGAGMSDRTTILTSENNRIDIVIPNTQNYTLSFEGVSLSAEEWIYIGNENNADVLKKVAFTKCRLGNIKLACFCEQLTFVNDIINSNSDLIMEEEAKSNVNFINCYVNWLEMENNTSSLYNCIVRGGTSSTLRRYYENCIICSQLSNASICKNCLFVGSSNFFGTQAYREKCHSVNNYADVFSTSFDGTEIYAQDETFELKPNAASTYLGTDGTQVGMYGGYVPYDPRPSYPQITKMNVAKKTTADGKLSVDIEVTAAE